MRFRLAETKFNRNVSVDIDVTLPDEEFVGLVDVNNSPNKIKPLIDSAFKGLKNGNTPQLCEEGVGGTYFMHDHTRKKVGVFKPQDEEAYNVNNPKGYRPRVGSDAGFKEGIIAGEASIRECIAYMLDHQNFANVPVTDLVMAQHPAFYYTHIKPSAASGASSIDGVEDHRSSRSSIRAKIGSFQEFVDHDGDCEDISRSLLMQFPVDEVHKIAQLDIRLMNADRHGGNILYREVINDYGEESYVLIPIDHGYALPLSFSDITFEWLNWSQAKDPMSESTLRYIDSINVEQEIELLRSKFGKTLREEHFRVLRISTTLLKKGAKMGLTFHDIGGMICRENIDDPSTLEQMMNKMADRVNDPMFYTNMEQLMDKEINNLLLDK